MRPHDERQSAYPADVKIACAECGCVGEKRRVRQPCEREDCCCHDAKKTHKWRDAIVDVASAAADAV